MTRCRYDRHRKAHLLREHVSACVDTACPGCKPCTHDEHGNPVRHCRAKARCTSHLGWDEYACARCLGKARTHLRRIVDLVALMPPAAVAAGLNSEAANLAGPHADHVRGQWRLVNAARAGQEVEELDMRDPYTCLTMHERYVREELGHDETTLVSPDLATAASYLQWALTDLGRSEAGATLFAALRGDASALVEHLEVVLRNGMAPERGAPCPECVKAGGKEAPRLRRIYAHWCADPDCRRVHEVDADGVATDAADRWVCPDDRAHEWSHEAYSRWIEQRSGTGRGKVSA